MKTKKDDEEKIEYRIEIQLKHKDRCIMFKFDTKKKMDKVYNDINFVLTAVIKPNQRMVWLHDNYNKSENRDIIINIDEILTVRCFTINPGPTVLRWN